MFIVYFLLSTSNQDKGALYLFEQITIYYSSSRIHQHYIIIKVPKWMLQMNSKEWTIELGLVDGLLAV